MNSECFISLSVDFICEQQPLQTMFAASESTDVGCAVACRCCYGFAHPLLPQSSGPMLNFCRYCSAAYVSLVWSVIPIAHPQWGAVSPLMRQSREQGVCHTQRLGCFHRTVSACQAEQSTCCLLSRVTLCPAAPSSIRYARNRGTRIIYFC